MAIVNSVVQGAGFSVAAAGGALGYFARQSSENEVEETGNKADEEFVEEG